MLNMRRSSCSTGVYQSLRHFQLSKDQFRGAPFAETYPSSSVAIFLLNASMPFVILYQSMVVRFSRLNNWKYNVLEVFVFRTMFFNRAKESFPHLQILAC